MVPSGPSGLLGFRILEAGQQIYPWSNLYWLTPDNVNLVVTFEDNITVTGLVIQTYNLDYYPHSLYFRATVRNAPAQLLGVSSVAGVSQIMPSPTTEGTVTENAYVAPIPEIGTPSTEELLPASLPVTETAEAPITLAYLPTAITQVAATQIGDVSDIPVLSITDQSALSEVPQ